MILEIMNFEGEIKHATEPFRLNLYFLFLFLFTFDHLSRSDFSFDDRESAECYPSMVIALQFPK